MDIRETIKQFLSARQFPFTETARRFVVPIRVGDATIYVVIDIGDPWIETWAPLIKATNLPLDLNTTAFYKRLLQDTLYLREVTYGVTKQGDVAVHAEVHKNAFSREGFVSEFGAVIYGIKHFLEHILPEYPKIQVASDPPRTLWEPH